MVYTATPQDIQAIRYELNDNEAGLYILDDPTIIYYVEKNNGNISRTSLDCAKAILLRLSMDARDESVDVLSVKNSKAAEQYRLSLELYLRNPQLNPVFQKTTAWVGGVSKSEIEANNTDPDNNVTSLAVNEYPEEVSFSDNTFNN